MIDRHAARFGRGRARWPRDRSRGGYAMRHEVLQQIAVVAAHFDHQTARPELQLLDSLRVNCRAWASQVSEYDE